MTIIGSGTNCGRTARNSTLTEALVFHQTLSTPKSKLQRAVSVGHTPRENPKDPHFSQRSNNENELQQSLFHTLEFLKKYIITIPNTRVWNDNSGIFKYNI